MLSSAFGAPHPELLHAPYLTDAPTRPGPHSARDPLHSGLSAAFAPNFSSSRLPSRFCGSRIPPAVARTCSAASVVTAGLTAGQAPRPPSWMLAGRGGAALGGVAVFRGRGRAQGAGPAGGPAARRAFPGSGLWLTQRPSPRAVSGAPLPGATEKPHGSSGAVLLTGRRAVYPPRASEEKLLFEEGNSGRKGCKMFPMLESNGRPIRCDVFGGLTTPGTRFLRSRGSRRGRGGLRSPRAAHRGGGAAGPPGSGAD